MKKILLIILTLLLLTGCGEQKEEKKDKDKEKEEQKKEIKEVINCRYNQDPLYTSEKVIINITNDRIITVTHTRLLNMDNKDTAEQHIKLFKEKFKNNSLIKSKYDNNEWIVTYTYTSMNISEYKEKLNEYYSEIGENKDLSYLDDDEINLQNYKNIALQGYICKTQ